MSTAGFFMLLAVSVGVASFVLWPLLFSATAQPAVGSETSQLSELNSKREVILVALRDLDFDYSTGKLVEDDYRQQRAHLVSLGADILRQIDQLTPSAPQTQGKS